MRFDSLCHRAARLLRGYGDRRNRPLRVCRGERGSGRTRWWIPNHGGVPGNEHADRLAKKGAGGEQPNNIISYSEMRGIIRALNTPTRSRDDYHLMTEYRQRVLMRLCTGHNNLTHSPTCTCIEAEQTAEHSPIMSLVPSSKVGTLATRSPTAHQALWQP